MSLKTTPMHMFIEEHSNYLDQWIFTNQKASSRQGKFSGIYLASWYFDDQYYVQIHY
jgi:hypothetical protein